VAVGAWSTFAWHQGHGILPIVWDDRPAVRDRLESAVVIWLTTVSPTGQPQSSPVWFIVDRDELLVYSLARAPRMRNIRANPKVAFNLDSARDGDDIVTMEAEARIDPDAPPSTAVPAYMAKYRRRIEAYGWTPEGFAKDYPIALRFRVTRIRAS
jgi:PPOX class probable F420-dependent enzyme